MEIPTDYPSSLGHLSIGVGCATARIFFGFALAGSSIMSLGHAFQFVGYGLSRCIPYHFGTTAFGKSSRINWTINTEKSAYKPSSTYKTSIFPRQNQVFSRSYTLLGGLDFHSQLSVLLAGLKHRGFNVGDRFLVPCCCIRSKSLGSWNLSFGSGRLI